MSRKREAEALLSHPPDHTTTHQLFPGNASQRMIPRRSSGWDPYEVWRTRVKAPQEPVEVIVDSVRRRA